MDWVRGAILYPVWTVKRLCLVLTIAAVPACAEPDAPAMADALLAESGAAAVAVGWISSGHSGIAVRGLRARGHDGAATPVDLWHIGSNTKSMTATLAARLIEAGAMHWSDTVTDHLSDLDPHPGYASVTLSDLLAHRGRVPANLAMLATASLAGSDADRDARADRRVYARKVLSKPPRAPGFHYSNAGYVIAGAMMEAATGATWEDLMRREVFAPLGLDSAGFGPPGTATDTPDQPWGHGALFGRPVPPAARADNIPALGPAGRVHLNTGDHLRYLRAHLERPEAYLSAQSWARLQGDGAGQAYALGWAVRDGRLLHHGSNTLWLQRVELSPDTGMALILSTNSGALRTVRPVMDRIATVVFAQ